MYTHTSTRTHIHPCQTSIKRTHLHVGVSHSRKPVCDSVHVPAQAMNPINPGVKWCKEPSLIAFPHCLPSLPSLIAFPHCLPSLPSLIAFFGWLTVVVLHAIFVGFHNTSAGDFGTFVTFHGGTPGVSETSGSRGADDAHGPSTAHHRQPLRPFSSAPNT